MNSLARKTYTYRQPSLSKVGLPKNRVQEIADYLAKIKSIARTIDYRFVQRQKMVGKRIGDILLSLVGLVMLAVLYPFIALGIKLSADVPVIFKQKRTGFDGREFTFYKFSSMRADMPEDDEEQPTITEERDQRIFKFGQFLRSTNLDELPQFINVLRGDMSLVGPRPYTMKESSYWNSTFPDFHMRYAVKPGLTGLAQATGYRGGTLSMQHMSERLRRDLMYVKKRSMSMDAKLIWITVKKMINGKTDAH